MILLDVAHPPAVSFAFRAGDERSLILFALPAGVVATLVVLERMMLWLLN